MSNQSEHGVPEKILRQINALLALAQGSSNEHEAASAEAKAAELIQKYNLDMDAARNYEAAPVIHEERVFLRHYLPEDWRKPKTKKTPMYRYGRKRQYQPRAWPPDAWWQYGQMDWFVYLANAIAEVCECEAPLFSPGLVTFMGSRDNVKQAAYLMGNIFKRLMTMCESATKQYAIDYKAAKGVSPYKKSGYHHPTSFRVGWLEGAAMEIGTKLYEQHRNLRTRVEAERRQSEAGRATSEKTHNAIVVMHTAIEQYIAGKYPGIKTMEERESEGNYAGYEAGREAGENFGLQGGLGDSKRPDRLLGDGK